MTGGGQAQMSEETGKKWYVVTTYSGYENKVKAALQERSASTRWRSASARS